MAIERPKLEAAIFDMDGLLLESESLWRRAEAEAVERLGLPLTNADFESTMGVRMRDVARIWFDNWGWSTGAVPELTPDDVANQVIERVVELVADAVPLDGVREALALVADAGLRVALCSSSDLRLIHAALAALDMGDRFEVIHSAETDLFGKPHPEPYLSTATKLGVDPRRCVAFEDSVAGCISAKAAGMNVIAVPDSSTSGSGRFGFADVVLGSMTEFNRKVLEEVAAGVPVPSISRPRFHLAFPVNNLGAAREFYGGVLGCTEGRSAETWVDFNLWGHQIVAHLDPDAGQSPPAANQVDGHAVPATHFGVLLHVGAWHHLVDQLRAAEVPILIGPYVRFEGEPGEQHTIFVTDPAGNALEFKAFADDRHVFAS